MTKKDSDSGSIYSLKAVLNKNPIQLTGVIMLGLDVVIAAGIWHPTVVLLAALNAFLVALFGIFLMAKTENKAKLAEYAEATGGQEVVAPK